MLRVLAFEDLHVGMRESLMKTVMESDVVGFARLSGDDNPLHLCDVYAAHTRFGQRIAHGLYTASLISAVLGTRLPWPGRGLPLADAQLPCTGEDRGCGRGHGRGGRAHPQGPGRAACDCEALVDGKMVLDGEAVVSVPQRNTIAQPNSS